MLRAPSQDQRLFYLRAAEQGAWSVRQLREAIRTDTYCAYTGQPLAVAPNEELKAGTPLRPRFGGLHTYVAVEGGGHGGGEAELDLGFHLTGTLGALSITPPAALAVGAIVTARRVAASGGRPNRYTLTRRRPRTRRYTYVAWIRRIVDGDTLIAVVDLGFGLHTRPIRFRLRGIDCPELSTLAGRTARSFVEERLGQIDFAIISTHRTDAYGRYLADVRYLAGESDTEVVRERGMCLNRQLLDERLARPYQR